MDATTITATRRATLWGRMVGLIIGVPIYLSLLTTLPAVAAALVVTLYFGVPLAIQRAMTAPGPRPRVQ